MHLDTRGSKFRLWADWTYQLHAKPIINSGSTFQLELVFSYRPCMPEQCVAYIYSQQYRSTVCKNMVACVPELHVCVKVPFRCIIIIIGKGGNGNSIETVSLQISLPKAHQELIPSSGPAAARLDAAHRDFLLPRGRDSPADEGIENGLIRTTALTTKFLWIRPWACGIFFCHLTHFNLLTKKILILFFVFPISIDLRLWINAMEGSCSHVTTVKDLAVYTGFTRLSLIWSREPESKICPESCYHSHVRNPIILVFFF